jgi:hypothetical protein
VFVIDPRVTHWLAPHWNGNFLPFVGLSWDIPRRRAKTFARRLLGALDGAWKKRLDPRYAEWRPTSVAKD